MPPIWSSPFLKRNLYNIRALNSEIKKPKVCIASLRLPPFPYTMMSMSQKEHSLRGGKKITKNVEQSTYQSPHRACVRVTTHEFLGSKSNLLRRLTTKPQKIQDPTTNTSIKWERE